MKHFLTLLSIICIFFISSSFGAIVVNKSGPYYPGDSIGFNKTCHDNGNRADSYWNWGDGTPNTTHPDDSDYGWQYHSFDRPGTYTVTYYHGMAVVTPWCFTDTETYVITIQENRNITYAPANPLAGQVITFTANNFNTPDNIKWDMGDGTILGGANPAASGLSRVLGGNVVQHVYTNPGNYTIRAYDDNGTQLVPISLGIVVAMPNRRIEASMDTVRVDQPVYLEARGFLTSVIDWNYGDGEVLSGGSTLVMHRFQSEGIKTVTAKDQSIVHTPVEKQITVLPENRSLRIATPEVRINTAVQIDAVNFRGDLILWDFGDGNQMSGGHSVTHLYNKVGTYTITARDENGESQKMFTAQLRVLGITDEVSLEIAEIKFDNGKYYKVVPRNTKEISGVLTMKMKGTGSVTGYWLVDGNPFEFFNEVAVQGELKKIYTQRIPGLPTIEPGLHTLSVQLTKPANVQVTFPVLKYFVLPGEAVVETLSPKDGFVVKEKEIPTFSWKAPKGGSKYKIIFTNSLYPILTDDDKAKWIDVDSLQSYTPTKAVWDNISRNRWSYWKVRAYDTNGNIVAESGILEMKVVISTASISLNRITDLDGNPVKFKGGNVIANVSDLLVKGELSYAGNSKYLILKVYNGNKLVDQLLFRNVKKGEIRTFETSLKNLEKVSKIKFEVLKTSSPAVVIGIKGLLLRKK